MRNNLIFNSLLANYDDWFLPSTLELSAIHTELKDYGIGSLSNNLYWTSSETDSSTARVVNMEIGNTGSINKAVSTNSVRACRSFAGDAGLYNIRSRGPANGFIFAYSGGKYYEAAPSDQSGGKAWSNVVDVAIETTGAQIGDGKDNTTEIINQIGFTDGAAKLCNDLLL